MISLSQISLSGFFRIRPKILVLFALLATACTLPSSATSSNQEEPSVITTVEPIQPKSDIVDSPQNVDTEISIENTPVPTIDTNNSNEPVTIVGSAEITFPLFENYLVEPYVMLEDEAGFVKRDFDFVIPPQDQVLGPLTPRGDNTWDYVLHLPALPPGVLVDVDNNSLYLLAITERRTNS